jgi:uncharacterized protein (DUF1800 family)
MQLKHPAVALAAMLTLAGSLASIRLVLASKKDNSAATQMDEQKRAAHVLNRLTFGLRPGDVQRVTAMGVDKWIDVQLHPDRIDDGALTARLEPLRTLRMDTHEMVESFPPQQVIKAVADGKQALPSDPTRRAIYQAQLERYYQRQERKQQEAANSAAPPVNASANASATSAAPIADSGKDGMMNGGATNAGMVNGGATNAEMVSAGSANSNAEAARREDRLYADLQLDQLLGLSPDQRMKALLKMPPADEIAMAPSMKGKKAEDFLAGLSPQQKETVGALNNPQQVVNDELIQGKLLSDIYSERQLLEVMTDFWFNHFNVFIGKGADRYMLTSYERDVIRPHSLGKFEDLLVATAQSPAMLFYLDNWLSVGPHSDFALGIPQHPANMNWRRFPPPRPPRPKANRSGLNENYGRELMELHTLGVNGGYTQKDVTEVARVLTGWTVKEPREGGGFFFDERKHEPGIKVVLGHRIKPSGEKEGREVLHLLAHNPATAKFICTKLATRFVSDNPPPALVDRMTHTFLKKDGEIREVLKTMLQSPEFWAPDSYRAKVKTPLEFVVSAVRASDADVADAAPLVHQLQIMGMPLYGAQPPTGYSTKAEAWVNSSALLGRMNFALALTADKLRGIQVENTLGVTPNGSSDPHETLAVLETDLLAGDVSKQTHDTIASRLDDPKISQRKLDDNARPPNVSMIEGLLLGSPEFQRR